VFKPVKKLPVRRARGRRIHSALTYPISLRSILISVHWHPYLCLGLPNGLFPSRFRTKISYASLMSRSYYMFYLCHPHWLHKPNIISWREQIIQLLIRHMRFSTASRYFLPLRSKCSSRAIEWVPRVLSTGIVRPEREDDHLPPSPVEIKNAWSYTTASHMSSWPVSQLRKGKACSFTLPYSRTPSIYALFLMWGTKIHVYSRGGKMH
jgi:hypothetical protein